MVLKHYVSISFSEFLCCTCFFRFSHESPTFTQGSYNCLNYNPKSEKVGTVWKTQIKKKVVISKFTLTCISLQTIYYEHKIFHVLSGQLHVICKYTSFPVIQTCNTFQKKLGQEQFRASNEVNWLNKDVI